MHPTLYTPPDVEDAYTSWQASCGPASLAAILRRPLCDIRDVVLARGYAQRGYMNPTHMKEAFEDFGLSFCRTPTPHYGVLFIQWTGPWTAPGKPATIAYRHTHWIAGARAQDGRYYAYDINDVTETTEGASLEGGWRPWEQWKRILTRMITFSIPHADRGWYIRTGYAVVLPQERIECLDPN